MRSKAYNLILITRPLNLILGIRSIATGAVITGVTEPRIKVLLACFSGAMIMAAGNVINDYFDLDIDRVNKPFRPLPSGELQPQAALVFAIILFALAIFLSIFINFNAVLVATFTALGLFAYSAILKRKILVGNVAVSLFASLAFVYGAISVDRWDKALIPAGLAFLFHLGREIIKDVEDQAADESCSSQTLPIRYGQRIAFIVITFVFAILIVFTLVPYLLDIYGKRYFWTVLVGVDLVIVVAVAVMWARPQPESLRRISAVLKVDMLVGLFAVFLGQSTVFAAT